MTVGMRWGTAVLPLADMQRKKTRSDGQVSLDHGDRRDEQANTRETRTHRQEEKIEAKLSGYCQRPAGGVR